MDFVNLDAIPALAGIAVSHATYERGLQRKKPENKVNSARIVMANNPHQVVTLEYQWSPRFEQMFIFFQLKVS